MTTKTKVKYNKYSVTITDDYYTSDYSEDRISLEWASEHKKNFKPTYNIKKGFKTFKEALEYVYSLNTSDSIVINDTCCGEVYASINQIDTCKCCNHTTYEKVTSDSHHEDKKHDWQLAEIN